MFAAIEGPGESILAIIMMSAAVFIFFICARSRERKERLRVVEKALSSGGLDDQSRQMLVDTLTGKDSTDRPRWLASLYQGAVYLSRHAVEYEISHDLRCHIAECDAVYMTRLQDEHDVAGESKSIGYDRFSLTYEMAREFKPDLAILHPLPRRTELDQRLDSLPQAKYWAQVRNGMWMRAALIASIFNVDVAIRDHYHAYYTI